MDFGAVSTIEDYSVSLPLPDWQVYIANLAKKICQAQSPQVLLEARKNVYELLANCIPSTIIIQQLTKELLKRIDMELRHKVIKAAAFYEKRMQQGTKDVFHIEAFIAKFMYLYKSHLVECFG